MPTLRIDLNADLGEGYGVWRLGDDAAVLDVVTSANVACGFHAGDPAGLRRTCADAVAAGARIGAQVSYPDRVGFGRRFVDVAADDLTADVVYQIGALDGIARSVGGRVEYVKPHGALYNSIVTHEEQAGAVVAALVALGGDLPLLGLPDSASLRRAAAAGIRTVAEAFADRAYLADGSLMPRGRTGAVITDTAEICARAVRMVHDHEVVADDGSVVAVTPASICLHGDTPGAVEHARAVASALRDAGAEIAAFVG
ncbi:5-oxoprolinase subunit PxpA [Williamsia sp.]|uniref:LamB/YcsF family protein n=1 Tax=Williamsia sp. TaxID=1872085 RepID=UPI001A2E5809|nr:5-oxoprolinase subunit PxpA [Williamsia sp.]MBJ7290780.1 LamB/YcsF family protein [Williamsia sp.]